MRKIISILLTVCMLLGTVTIFASAETDKSTPIILIHGMMGWGEDSAKSESNPYFGMGSGSLADKLRDEGYTVVAPSLSGMGSAWDRCCELYAKLTGTVVDYGEAHSKAHGHDRYGRDYSGEYLLGEAWDFSELILIGHSFGSPTAKAFASLCAYGNEAEREASGEDVSPLFAGGHNDAVKAVIGFVGPYNGSTLSDFMMDSGLGTFLALYLNIACVTGSDDYMLDQWGLQDKFSIIGSIKLLNSKDHCGYDMTIAGAKEMNALFPDNPDVLYMSYAACMDGNGGNILGPTSTLIKILSKFKYDGEKLGDDWAKSDGMVPLASALYPYGSEHVDYNAENGLVKGVWNVMPVEYGATHGYGCAPVNGDVEGFYKLYTDAIALANSK